MNTKLVSLFLIVIFSSYVPSNACSWLEYKEKCDQYELNEQFLHAAKTGCVEKFGLLLERGALVNYVDRFGNTALHYAASEGHAGYVKALIEAKADIHKRDQFGSTALHNAAGKGHANCIKILLAAGADSNVCESGNTAFHQAAFSGNSESILILLQAGAEVTARDRNGSTVFHWAVSLNMFESVKTLVKHSYQFGFSKEVISAARKRVFNMLLQFVWLRNKHPQLDNLKSESLLYEIVSYNKLLQEDLVHIFLDELKKGHEIKSVSLIRSKEEVITYLLKKIDHLIAEIPAYKITQDMGLFLERAKLEELIKQGLNERIEALKAKATV